jgi:hypothetical protein
MSSQQVRLVIFPSYTEYVVGILVVSNAINYFVEKYHTIAIYNELYDAHPHWIRPRVTYKSNIMCRSVILELFKLLLDIFLIGVQIGAIYFSTSGDCDALTCKNGQVMNTCNKSLNT